MRDPQLVFDSRPIPGAVVTYLFVPAHEPAKATRAMASEADAVIFDLEASVPDALKAAARASIDRYLETLRTPTSPQVWVRVNVPGPHLDADLTAIDWDLVAGAIVAQAEDADTLRMIEAAGAKKLIPLIESVAGFDSLSMLGAVRSVERFAIGTWDLALDLGLLAISDPDESEMIWRLRGDLVLASRRRGLRPPVDGVYARLSDDSGLRAVCDRAHRIGYGAKMLIHPAQLAVAASVFRPDETELRYAREIVHTYDEAVQTGRGVTQLRGQMIDLPVVVRARALLARWPDAVLALDRRS